MNKHKEPGTPEAEETAEQAVVRLTKELDSANKANDFLAKDLSAARKASAQSDAQASDSAKRAYDAENRARRAETETAILRSQVNATADLLKTLTRDNREFLPAPGFRIG